MNYKNSKRIIFKLVKLAEELEEDFASEGGHSLYEMEEDKTKKLLYLSKEHREIINEAESFLKNDKE